MALLYYFFNAKKTGETYDRVYSASDLTDYLNGLVGSGVFPTPSTCLQVVEGTGMNVRVKPGMGWIEGHKLVNTADLSLEIDAADVTLNRIDRIVFRVNNIDRTMEILVKKGTNASSPQAPNVVRTQDVIEYSLAMIRVNRNTTAISQNMITDTRPDSKVCGWVQGLIQQVDTSTLYAQWESAYQEQFDTNQDEFETWFENVKDSLSTAVMWKEYKNVIVTDTTNVETVNIGISQYNSTVDILTVYINGLRLDQTEYTSNETQITFTNALDVIGTVIEIVVYKSVNGEGAETVLGQVTQLQQDVVDLQNDVAGINNYVKQNVNIQTSSWQSNDDWYVATIQDENITSDHIVDVTFHLDSLDAATEAEVQNITESGEGTIKLYAKSIPTMTLICDYSYMKGVAA